MTSTKRVTVGLDRVIGLRIQAARHEIEMSQKDLGVSLGLTFQQVQKYEKGVNRVSASTLVHIAETLRKPVTYFIDPPKYKPNTKGEEIAEFAASVVGAKLLAAANELSPALQQSLVDLARTMGRVSA